MAQPRAFIQSNPDASGALVVVFLRGGADGLGLVCPYSDDTYHKGRPNLGLGEKDIVRLDDRFGLNLPLAPLASLFHDGHLAVVHAAGSEDTSRSHFEAQDWMEHGGPTAGGWLGRYLRFRPQPAEHSLAAVAIGKVAPEVLRGAPSSVVFESFSGFSFGSEGAPYLDALSALYADTEGYLGKASHDTLHAIRVLEQLGQHPHTPEHGAVYPDDAFGQGLARIAQLIKSQVGLCAATIDLGGWDSHFAQATLIHPLMDSLARGLLAFHHDLGDRRGDTTVVVMSEFGRRVYENASYGTDHGRGGVMFLLGGGVAGARVYAPWKTLADTQLEGPGDLPVLHNYRDVLIPILARHGGMSDFSQVFPEHAAAPLPLFA